MNGRWSLRSAALALLGLFVAAALPGACFAQADLAPGQALYAAHCGACHDNPDATRAPPKSALGAMSPADLEYALTGGKMKVQGSALTDIERRRLISYLTGARAGGVEAVGGADRWSQAMACPPDRPAVDLSGPAVVTTFGFDRRNTRSLAARQAGLTKAQLSNLELAWAIAIPGATTMRSQPAIVGKTVFLPVADARAVYAFDVSRPLAPCVKWVFRTSTAAPLRSSAGYGVLADGRGVLSFTGFDNIAYLLDAKTGKPIWSRNIGSYAYNQATATPVVLKDRIIIPMSQYEIVVAGANNQTCCTHHGYVVSLDPRTGAQQWRYDTMEDAKPVRDRGDGKFLYGPSGAPIWTSPAIDEARGLIYVGTGESNSEPVSRNTDAMIAIGLADGKERWSHQATDKDIYLSGCGPHPKAAQLNCAKDTVFRDVDFGASMVLARLKGGREVMLGGQKSGTVWALDAATGKLVWRNDLGSGSPLGGVHWGLALDGQTVFVPISAVRDNYLTSLLPNPPPPSAFKPGMYALDAATGAVKWSFATTPDCAGDRPKRVPTCARAIGMSAAPAVIDGAVVEGALDGYLYVLDGATGKLLWKFDTAIPYHGLNGVDGKGGAIDAASITAGDGLLFVNSGYAMFGQTSGNMILAFKPKAN